MGGAGGARGTAVAARASADGITLLLAGSGVMVIIPLAGFEPESDASPEKMRGFLSTELARWKPVVDASGFKLD